MMTSQRLLEVNQNPAKDRTFFLDPRFKYKLDKQIGTADEAINASLNTLAAAKYSPW